MATRGRIELPWSDRQSDVITIIRTSQILVEAAGVEPALFTTRERIYSPLQNTPYLQCLQNYHLLMLLRYSLALTVLEFDFNASAYSQCVQRAFAFNSTPDCAFLGDTTTQRFTIQWALESSIITSSNGTRYESRTRLLRLKTWCPNR